MTICLWRVNGIRGDMPCFGKRFLMIGKGIRICLLTGGRRWPWGHVFPPEKVKKMAPNPFVDRVCDGPLS